VYESGPEGENEASVVVCPTQQDFLTKNVGCHSRRLPSDRGLKKRTPGGIAHMQNQHA